MQEQERKATIVHNFTYHAPKEGQVAHYEQIRERGKELALFLAENTPYSREQSQALTNLEQAIFWANAALARHKH